MTCESLPNNGNGMYCAEGMAPSTEVCDECYELLDDCECDDLCACGSGEFEEDCECEDNVVLSK